MTCLYQVSDRGGGVPLRIIDRLFSYTYSTAPTPVMDNSRNAPLVRPIKWPNASQPSSSKCTARITKRKLGKLINLVKLYVKDMRKNNKPIKTWQKTMLQGVPDRKQKMLI